MRAYPLFLNRQEEITFVVHLRRGLYIKLKLYPKNLLEIQRIVAFMQASMRATLAFLAVFCYFTKTFG